MDIYNTSTIILNG